MATLRQQKAVAITVANRGKSKAEIIRKAGYKESTARNPKRVFGSEAVQELLPDIADDVLVKKAKRTLNYHLDTNPESDKNFDAAKFVYGVNSKQKVEHSASKELMVALTETKKKYSED